MIKSGTEVATPKIAGSTKPYEVEATVGISHTKKKYEHCWAKG